MVINPAMNHDDIFNVLFFVHQVELTLVNGVTPASTTATSGTRRRLREGVPGGAGEGYSGGVEEEAALLRGRQKRGLQTDVSDYY